MRAATRTLAALALVVLAPAAIATPIRMIAEGQIGFSTFPGIAVGDPWVIEVVFDPATMIENLPATETQARYVALQSFSVVAGAFSFDETNAGGIAIINDFVAGNTTVDEIAIGSVGVFSSGIIANVIADHSGGPPLTSVALPTDADQYNAFFLDPDFLNFGMVDPDDHLAAGVPASVRFVPVSVSEPGTLALMLLGAVGLMML